MRLSPPSTSLLRHDTVFHVGTLDRAHRGSVYKQSHEGHCLSVSTCPEAWRSIARLGAAPVWQLHRHGGLFIEALAAREDSAFNTSLVLWGMEAGLVEVKTLWSAWQEDAETLDWRYTLHASREDAVAEVEDPQALTPFGHPCVHLKLVTLGLPALAGRVCVDLRQRDAWDFLLMAWAEQCTNVDGIWWNEVLDVLGLSAPRGALFPSRVEAWRAECLGSPVISGPARAAALCAAILQDASDELPEPFSSRDERSF